MSFSKTFEGSLAYRIILVISPPSGYKFFRHRSSGINAHQASGNFTEIFFFLTQIALPVISPLKTWV
jgi:hypothetical protein